MVRNANKELEQFKSTFGFKALREDFNRPAAIHLKNNIHDYINGDEEADEKADHALELITKLIDSSMVSVLCNTVLQPLSPHHHIRVYSIYKGTEPSRTAFITTETDQNS
jgi:hypothetical protein